MGKLLSEKEIVDRAILLERIIFEESRTPALKNGGLEGKTWGWISSLRYKQSKNTLDSSYLEVIKKNSEVAYKIIMGSTIDEIRASVEYKPRIIENRDKTKPKAKIVYIEPSKSVKRLSELICGTDKVSELAELNIHTVADLDNTFKMLFRTYKSRESIKNEEHLKLANAVGWVRIDEEPELLNKNCMLYSEIYKMYDRSIMFAGELRLLCDILNLKEYDILYRSMILLYGGLCGRLRNMLTTLEPEDIDILVEKYYLFEHDSDSKRKQNKDYKNAIDSIKKSEYFHYMKGIKRESEDKSFGYSVVLQDYDIERQKLLVGLLEKARRNENYMVGSDYAELSEDFEKPVMVYMGKEKEILNLRDSGYSPRMK